MKKNMKVVGLLAGATILAAAMAIGCINVNVASAEENEVVTFEMYDGAGVKWTSTSELNSGIRFGATVSKDYVDSLAANGVVMLHSTIDKAGNSDSGEAKTKSWVLSGEEAVYDASYATNSFYHTIEYSAESLGANFKKAAAVELTATMWLTVNGNVVEDTTSAVTRSMRAVANAAYEEETEYQSGLDKYLGDRETAETVYFSAENGTKCTIKALAESDYTEAYLGAQLVGTVENGTITFDAEALAGVEYGEYEISLFDDDNNVCNVPVVYVGKIFNEKTDEVFLDFDEVANFSSMGFMNLKCWAGLTGETINGVTLDKAHGGSGKALGMTAGNNVGDYAVAIDKDFSKFGMEIPSEYYFYVYFDSTTAVYGDFTALPEITDERIASLSYSRWTFTAQSEKAWDTWILVKAENTNEGTGISLTPRHTWADWGIDAPAGVAANTATGFSCVMYVDDFFMEKPEVPEEINGEVFMDFDTNANFSSMGFTNMKCWAGLTGETINGVTLDKAHGGSGKALGMTAGDNVGDYAVAIGKDFVKLSMEIPSEYYFYVYFDSTTAVYGDFTALPEITDERIASLSYSRWTFTAQTEKVWDTWILVKAENTNEGDGLYFTPRHTWADWGITAPAGVAANRATGFSCVIYVDDIYLPVAEPTKPGIDGNVFMDFDANTNFSSMGFTNMKCWAGLTGETINGVTLDKAHGESGKALGMTAGDNVGDYAVAIGKDFVKLSMEIPSEYYFYVYFDSTTAVYGDFTALPEITDERIASLSYSRWTFTAQSEKAWDTWILVKAENTNEGDGLYFTPRHTWADWGITAPAGVAANSATGFSCVIYVDDIYLAN